MLYAYSQFRVFGCLYYAHITKEDREKFDAKARKWVMALRLKHIGFTIWKEESIFQSGCTV